MLERKLATLMGKKPSKSLHNYCDIEIHMSTVKDANNLIYIFSNILANTKHHKQQNL